MKTELDIINETVEFYSTDTNRRAITKKGNCEYLTSDGRKCAVGRCFDENKMNKDIYEIIKEVIPIKMATKSSITLDNLLKDEYKGHSTEFWSKLQLLHDVSQNWIENGLSKYGHEYLNNLKEEYGK